MNPNRRRRAWLPAAIVALALIFRTHAALAGVGMCVGDCNNNGNVSSPELKVAVNIALGDLSLEACTAASSDDDDAVTIDDLVLAVNEHLHECAFVTPTPTPTPLRPDLVPESVTLVATPVSGCIGSLSDINSSLVACVRNQGQGPAPAFAATLAGLPLDFPALPAGEQECVSMRSGGFPGDIILSVDPENAVVETDETNNQGTFNVPVLTPPLTCTVTPTHTPLPPGTPSETPASTGTPTTTATPCSCFATHTSTRTFTPTPTPSPTPGLPDLLPNRIVVVAPTPVGGCVDNLSEVELSLLLCVLNDSNGAAGPFQSSLTVASSVFVEFEGAPADSEVCAPGPFIDGSMEFSVDTRDEVAEKNESNNQKVFSVLRPTPPPICPTRTPTPK